MAADNLGLGSCVVVVGDPGGALVRTTVQLAREGDIDAVVCGDVYAAVAHLGRVVGRRVLAVGTMQELARENGIFFRIAAAHGISCCCLLDPTGPVGRQGLARRWRPASRSWTLSRTFGGSSSNGSRRPNRVPRETPCHRASPERCGGYTV